jgi:hypothetical protein
VTLAQPTRYQGRYATAYPDDRELYDVVRAVAIAANKVHPTGVSTRGWDAARAKAGHPDAPSARRICARLCDRDGNPFPWRELLEAVCDPSRDDAQTDAGRTRQAEAPHLDERHVFFALRRAAQHLTQDTLTPADYTHARDELIAHARRAGSTAVITHTMPTIGQTMRIVGDDWPAALALAELEPASRRVPRGMPIQTALGHYHQHNVELPLPSYRTLVAFANKAQFALQACEHGKTWSTYLDEYRRHLADCGIPHDIPGPNRQTPDFAYPEDGIPDAPRRPRPRGWWHDLDHCLAVLDEWDTTAERTHKRTDLYYEECQKTRPDWPAKSAFGRHGGIQRCLRIVRDRRRRRAAPGERATASSGSAAP